MKSLPTFLLSSIMLLLIIGCSPQAFQFFQLVEVGSTNCRFNDNYVFSENDTLRIVYMFWGKNGVMGIFIHNKTEYPLYIDWKKCSFITGTTKHDYWDETTTITTSGTSSTYGSAQTEAAISSDYWFTNFLSSFISGTGNKRSESSSNWFQQKFFNSMTRLTKPERITFIPPHSTIFQAAYNLVFGGITLSPSFPISSRDTILYFPAKRLREQMIIAVFNASNSPINFRSFITYSTDDKFTTEHFLDSKFYVSCVLDLPQSAFNGQPDATSVEQSNKNMWASPSSFYIFSDKGLKIDEVLKTEEIIDYQMNISSQLANPSDKQYLYPLDKRKMVRIYIKEHASEDAYLVGETPLYYFILSNMESCERIQYVRKTIITKLEDIK